MHVFLIILFNFIQSNLDSNVFLIQDNLIRYYDEELQPLEEQILELPQEIKIDAYTHATINDRLYFFGGKSGQVYTIEGNKVKRIDETIDHRMTINATIFVHHDTIFKYGGYGYWSQRNFMTYFDFVSKEWEVYKKNTSYNPKGRYGGFHFKTEDKIYFFGGARVDENDRLKSIENKEIVSFDFKTKKYSLLGTTTFDLSNWDHLVNSNSYILLKADNFLYKVDLINNKLLTYELPPFLWKTEQRLSHQNSYKNGEFRFVVKDNFDQIEWIKIKEDLLFALPIKTEPFFESKKDTRFIYILLLAFLLFVLMRYILIKQRKKTVILNEKGVVRNAILHPLNEAQIKVLKVILLKGEISTAELLKIIEKDTLSYVHNIRLKNDFITQLNYELKTIFGFSKEPLELKRGEIDRRIKYLVPKEAFQVLLKKIKVT